MRCVSRWGGAVLIAVSLAARAAGGAQQPPDSLRLIAATGSTCHTRPDPGSPIAERYHLGDVVGASKSARGVGGRIWYFDAWRVNGISPTCWVPANVTVPFSREHPEPGFAAVVDRVLARGDSASFETLVEAEDFLEEPHPYAGVGESPLATSGLLQFRRLQLIERAAGLVDAHELEEAPLRRAWVLAHRDVLVFDEPDAEWHVPNENYWKIYDANSTAAWAEELAWYAAQRVPPGDECDANCFLAMITSGPQQYWTRRPSGSSIGKVLALAARFASEAIDAVEEGAPTRPAIDTVRASLTQVQTPSKQGLLDRLTRLDHAVKP